MAQAIDLDKARAGRREAQGEAPVVRFGSRDFVLPIELPLEVSLALADIENAQDGTGAARAVREVVRILLGSQMEAFMALQPSMNDLEALFEGMLAEYGLTAGESQAPEDSSTSTSELSKQISKPTTDSISASASGEISP